MKNKIILLTVLLATSLLSNAQLYVGAKVGLNLANISASFPKTTFSTKIGINGGATLKYHFQNTMIGTQMDILYSQMGSHSKKVEEVVDASGSLKTTTKIDYDFTYLQIPIYVNWEIPIKSEKLIPYRYTENIASVHLYGGGFFGYGIGNNVSTSITQYAVDVDNNATTTVIPKVSGASKKFNAIDFGLALGAGVSFNISKVGKLTVDVRYIKGMGNFNSNKAFNNGAGKYPVMTNSAPQIQLGYIHRITKPRRW